MYIRIHIHLCGSTCKCIHDGYIYIYIYAYIYIHICVYMSIDAHVKYLKIHIGIFKSTYICM